MVGDEEETVAFQDSPDTVTDVPEPVYFALQRLEIEPPGSIAADHVIGAFDAVLTPTSAQKPEPQSEVMRLVRVTLSAAAAAPGSRPAAISVAPPMAA